MGAVQRLATVVIVGLVAISTILVLVIADEDSRIAAEQEEQEEAQIERATADYLSLCMSCHGPAGLGYTAGDGRIGAPLNTTENQYGENAEGTPVPGGFVGRTDVIHTTIDEGRTNTAMPAWGEDNSGPLNDEQINELVVMIQHVDWNHVYNEAVEANGGVYPPAPTAAPADTEESEQPSEPNTYNISLQDNFFEPADLVVPANTDITLNLTNDGVSVHTFDIDELGVNSGDIASGETKTLTFNTGGAAEYQYYCAIPGHREAGMVGTFTVTDDPSLLPQPATATEGGGAGASTPQAEAQGGTTFDVEMVDIAFTQTELTVPANTEVTINLVNNGASTHTFDIDELGVNSGEYAAGQTGTVTFNTGEPGTYDYYCAIPGHKEAGMVGTLIVQ